MRLREWPDLGPGALALWKRGCSGLPGVCILGGVTMLLSFPVQSRQGEGDQIT